MRRSSLSELPSKHVATDVHRNRSIATVFQKRETRQSPDGPREELIIIGVYVDDLFVLHSHDNEFSLHHSFTTAMQKQWEVDDEGEVLNDLLNTWRFRVSTAS